jgi:hypothetical protein
MLKIGQERLPAILIVQPRRQKPTTQQPSQPMLLRPKKPQQHIIEKRLAAGAHRLQERDGEQAQRHRDDQALQGQGAARRPRPLGRAVLPGRQGQAGGRRRPLGDVALHA